MLRFVPVANASSYLAEINVGIKLWKSFEIPASVCIDNICSFHTLTNTTVGVYKWRVRAKVNNANTSFSAYKSFSVTKLAPITPVGVVNSSRILFQWNDIPGAEQYKVIIPTSFSSTESSYFDPADCQNKICTIDPNREYPYGTYSWSVQAKVGGVWMPAVKTTYHTIDLRLIEPEGNILTDRPVFRWTYSPGVTEYNFEYWQIRH